MLFPGLQVFLIHLLQSGDVGVHQVVDFAGVELFLTPSVPRLGLVEPQKVVRDQELCGVCQSLPLVFSSRQSYDNLKELVTDEALYRVVIALALSFFFFEIGRFEVRNQLCLSQLSVW